MDWAAGATELLWVGGLAAIPLALLVALACRWPGCRPATRHAMWAAVLVSFVTPAAASLLWRPAWFESGRMLALAEQGIERLRAELDFELVVTPPPPPAAELSAHAPPATAAPGASSAPAGDRDGSRLVRRRAEASGGAERAGRFASRTERGAGVDEPRTRGSVTVRSRPGVSPRAESPAPDARLAAPGLAAVEERRVPASEPARQVNGERGSARRAAPQRREETPARATSISGSGGLAAPSPAAAPSSTPLAAEPDWVAELKGWAWHAVAVRDSVAELPPLPVWIWAGGIVMLVLVGTARGVGFGRVLRGAREASPQTLELVRAAAAELGMRRVPVTLMTGDRVSPMVWCGLRRRLVLPAGLWRELDADSRRAVLLHELAHLKRKDHWLCWLGALVGLVYWWHPVAWWARKRVRDEADAACDAWVTSLMPRSRRAYAEALVTTKWYLSYPGRRAPRGLAGVGALGVVSGRTKQLARRLKMVMTQRVAPRTSMAGALMALGVLVTGMFVMPGLACPPEESAKAEKDKMVAQEKAKMNAAAKAEKAKMNALAKAEKALKASRVKAAQTPRGEVEFYGEAPALEAMRRAETDAAARRSGAGEEEMLRRLEERIRRLEEQLRRLEGQRGAPRPGAHGTPAPSAPRVVVQGTVAPRGMAAPAARTPERMARAEALVEGAEVSREYRLPEGKLQALIELMARDDVPVMIERHPDRIVVRAPESKQRVFAAFVKLIHPEAEVPVALMVERSAGVAPALRALREQEVAKVRQLRDQMRQVEQQRREVERAAERSRERSVAVEIDVETLREHLEQLREHAHEHAHEHGAEAKKELEKHLKEMVSHLDAKARSMTELLADASVQESMLETLEAALEDLEAQIEEAFEGLGEDLESIIEESLDVIEVEASGVPVQPTPAIAPAAPPVPSGATPVPPAAATAPAPPPAPVGTPAPALPPSGPAPRGV